MAGSNDALFKTPLTRDACLWAVTIYAVAPQWKRRRKATPASFFSVPSRSISPSYRVTSIDARLKAGQLAAPALTAPRPGRASPCGPKAGGALFHSHLFAAHSDYHDDERRMSVSFRLPELLPPDEDDLELGEVVGDGRRCKGGFSCAFMSGCRLR